MLFRQIVEKLEQIVYLKSFIFYPSSLYTVFILYCLINCAIFAGTSTCLEVSGCLRVVHLVELILQC